MIYALIVISFVEHHAACTDFQGKTVDCGYTSYEQRAPAKTFKSLDECNAAARKVNERAEILCARIQLPDQP